MTTKTANGRNAATGQFQAAGAPLLDRVIEATAVQRYTLEEVRYIADAVSKSEMYGLTPNQAFVLLELAESEGLHPIQAVRRYHIVEGKPSMRADAMQAEFQRRGGRVRWLESNGQVCEAEFTHSVYHPDPFVIRVTLEELIKSEVAMTWPKPRRGEAPDYSKGKVLKDTYKKFPRQMLRARAISEGVRAVDPGVVVGIYTPEEVSDFDEALRPDAPPRPAPKPTPQPAPKPAPRPAPELVRPEDVVGPRHAACSAWIQDQIDLHESEWQMTCAGSKLAHAFLGEKGRRLNIWQVLNGVVSSWLEDEQVEPEHVNTAGKRDREKVKAMIKAEWDDPERRLDLCADISQYLRDKLDVASRAAGINPDSEPPEEATDG